MLPLSAIKDFQLANPLYAGATVAFYAVSNGIKTSSLAPLYKDQAGAERLPNPQELDSDGKFKQPVYFDQPVIGVITGLSVGAHDTGIIAPAPIFRIETTTRAVQYSWDGGISWNESGGSFFRDRGGWLTGVLYTVTDLVTQSGALYFCNTEHTSSTFDAAKFTLIFNFSVGVPASSIVVTPTGDIQSTNAQAALAELDSEKFAKAGGTITGDQTFSGNSRRIKGDLANAAHTNRLMVQNSGNDAASSLGVIPNGTAQYAAFSAYNASTPDNASLILSEVSNINAGIRVTKTGSGALLPLVISVGDAERLRILTDGKVGIAVAVPLASLHVRGAALSTHAGGGLGVAVLDSPVPNGQNVSLDFKSTDDAVAVGRISMQRNVAGSILYLGTSNNYAVGVTNNGLVIDHEARVGIRDAPDTTARLYIGASDQNGVLVNNALQQGRGIRTLCSNAGFNGAPVMNAATNVVANSNFSFFIAESDADGTPDNEFHLRGDGNAFADGSWAGGGADYAEYFEWADGNSNSEDRRGMTVVLDGERVRVAVGQLPQDIIGVVSSTPVVVGDAAWNHWRERYLRDEFGDYVMEDYKVYEWDEVTSDKVTRRSHADYKMPPGVVPPPEAIVTVQRRRKPNPQYDPSKPYVPRHERKEWAAIGLVGKLWVRKGQLIGDRWKLMKTGEIADLYLVR